MSIGNNITAEEAEEIDEEDVVGKIRRTTTIVFKPPPKNALKPGLPKIEEKKENSAKSQPVKEEKGTKDTPAPEPPKLFENFYMVGVDKEDIIQFHKENPGAKEGYLTPKFLFFFPGTEEDMKKAPRNSIPDFVFPFKVKVTCEKIVSNSDLFEVILAKNTSDHNVNCFTFPLLPGEVDISNCDKSDIIREGNPNSVLYMICIKTTDYMHIEIPTKGLFKRKKKKYWKVERVYCFMTFYPIIKFFMDLNVHILGTKNLLNVLAYKIDTIDLFKIQRIKRFSESANNQMEAFKQVDANWVQEYISTQLMPYFYKVLLHPPGNLGSTMKIAYAKDEAKDIMIPTNEFAFTMEAVWACPLVFSYLPLADFMYLFSIVLSERKLVIMSTNLNLLTSTLMVLYSFLKPFKYTYPLIFNLPEVLLPLCDAPGGALIGINKGADYLLAEDLPGQYIDCIFAVFEETKISLYADPSNRIPVVEPHLGGLKNSIANIYYSFNEEKGKTIEYADSIKPSTQSTSGLAHSPSLIDDSTTTGVVRKGKKTQTKVLYNAGQTEHNKCEKIMKIFYDAFMTHIINHIPQEPLSKKEGKDGDLDYALIASKILEKNPDDKEFMEGFLTTQIFCYYLETFYSKMNTTAPS